jgi:hypothetical protein
VTASSLVMPYQQFCFETEDAEFDVEEKNISLCLKCVGKKFLVQNIIINLKKHCHNIFDH